MKKREDFSSISTRVGLEKFLVELVHAIEVLNLKACAFACELVYAYV